jgi:hypothetical protein
MAVTVVVAAAAEFTLAEVQVLKVLGLVAVVAVAAAQYLETAAVRVMAEALVALAALAD